MGIDIQNWHLSLKERFEHTIHELRDAYACSGTYYDVESLYCTVVIPELDKVNKNGRIYTSEIAERLCELDVSNMMGELGHSEGWDTLLSNVSHRIHELYIHDGSLWATFSLIPTERGRYLAAFLNTGKMVMRPKGVGSLSDGGMVESDFKLLSLDFIPANEDAFGPITGTDVEYVGRSIFNDKADLDSWMSRPSAFLGGMTPYELIIGGESERVMEELLEIKYANGNE